MAEQILDSHMIFSGSLKKNRLNIKITVTAQIQPERKWWRHVEVVDTPSHQGRVTSLLRSDVHVGRTGELEFCWKAEQMLEKGMGIA